MARRPARRDSNTNIREQDDLPPPQGDGEDDGSNSQSYSTGPDYPAEDGEGNDLPPDDDAPPEGFGEGRDIYGEDDPLPDEVESDGEGARSEDSPEVTRSGPPRKLVVLAGPDKGKVKRFSGVRMVIGRTSGCTLHLSDSSVSRRHLELVQGSNGVMLRDLGSGNGTKVNGERITERLLKHEDVIEIGQTKLQFVDELEAVRLAREEAERKEAEEKAQKDAEERQKAEAAAAAKAAEEAAKSESEPQVQSESGAQPAVSSNPAASAPRKQGGLARLDFKQKIGIGLAGGAVLFVMFLVLPALFRGPTPQPPSEKEVRATKKMDLARVAIADERFEDAITLIEQAEKLMPGIDADGFGARARNELAAQKAIDNTRSFLDQQRFEDARAELARFPAEASAKRVEAKAKLEEELNLKQNEYLERIALEAIEKLDIVAAKQLIAQLPVDKQKPFLAKLAEAEKEAQREERLRAAQDEADRKRRKVSAEAAHQAEVDALFRAVERKFNMGDFERATLECDRVIDSTRETDVRQRAMNLKRSIPLFARAWEDADRKYKAGAMESAARPLMRAKDLYREIRLPGLLGAALDEHLVGSLNVAARAALARGDLATAYTYYREVQTISPGEETSKQGLERIADKSEDLFREAYAIRESDPREAISKFKVVLDVAPKGSAAYNKAKAQLASMQP